MRTRDDELCGALGAYRIKYRVNQATMARTLGVSQSQISRWESGRDVPRAHNDEAIRALVYGHSDPQMVALIHMVQSSRSAMALFDSDHRVIAASASLTHPGGPFAQWGWLFDPGANPAFTSVYQRYRAILADLEGTVGLRVRVPFLLEDDPWCAEAHKTIQRIGGVGVCVAEISFLPDPGGAQVTPSLERIAPGLQVTRALRRRQASRSLLGA